MSAQLVPFEYQTDLFIDDTRVIINSLIKKLTVLEKDLETTKASLNKVRKGTYASIGEIRKEVEPVKHELSTLKDAMVRCSI